MGRRKVHEGCHWRMAKFGCAPERNFFLTKQLQGKQARRVLRKVSRIQLGRFEQRGWQLQMYGIHISNVPYSSQFVDCTSRPTPLSTGQAM